MIDKIVKTTKGNTLSIYHHTSGKHRFISTVVNNTDVVRFDCTDATYAYIDGRYSIWIINARRNKHEK